MRAREYLLEYNRQKTEQNYGDKIVMIARRDPTIPQQVRKEADNLQLVDIVLSQLEKADPTKNKEYTQGLAKLYANGGLKMEDASSTLADYLTKFHKLKTKRMIPSPRNDFLRYTNVGDFMSVVDEYPNPDEDAERQRRNQIALSMKRILDLRIHKLNEHFRKVLQQSRDTRSDPVCGILEEQQKNASQNRREKQRIHMKRPKAFTHREGRQMVDNVPGGTAAADWCRSHQSGFVLARQPPGCTARDPDRTLGPRCELESVGVAPDHKGTGRLLHVRRLRRTRGRGSSGGSVARSAPDLCPRALSRFLSAA